VCEAASRGPSALAVIHLLLRVKVTSMIRESFVAFSCWFFGCFEL